MKSDLVDIACTIVRESEKAIAIIDGTEEEIASPFTGEIKKRAKWFWLPRAAIEINDDGTVTMPERLAMEKGLI